MPYDLGLILDWIAQAQLYALVRDDVLQKLRAIYIRNVFDLDIRLKDDHARQQLCEALGLAETGAKGILQQLECDTSYLRLREVKEAMRPAAAIGGEAAPG